VRPTPAPPLLKKLISLNITITVSAIEAMWILIVVILQIIGPVFLILGMINALFAKYTPAIIESLVPEMEIKLPELTMLDAWADFFGSVGLMGLIVLAIVFSGIIANELSRGTLIVLLTVAAIAALNKKQV